MVQFEELLLRLEGSKADIDDLSDALGLKSMLSEIEQLELKATEPGFWDNVENSQKILQEFSLMILAISCHLSGDWSMIARTRRTIAILILES